MKKILIISNLFYPDSTAGSAKLLFYYAQELIKKGHQVSVLATKHDQKLADSEVIDGIKVVRYSFSQSKYWGKSLSDIFLLSKKLRDLAPQYDLVMTYNAFQAVALIKTKIKISLVYLFFASNYNEFLLEGVGRKTGILLIDRLLGFVLAHLVKFYENKALKFAKKIIVLSDYSKKILLGLYNIKEEKIVKIPAGIDLQRFKRGDKTLAKKQLQLPINKPVLLTVRRLVARMGLENLIMAVKKLSEEGVDFILLIGGQGPLEKQLKNMVANNDLSRQVQFAGFIKDQELPLYYQAADVFILPTLAFEGFGLVTLESLSCGTPVLGTPAGATPEILKQLNPNWVFKSSKAEDIYQGILNFINSETDPLLEMKMSALISKKYSWDLVGEKLNEQINNL